MVYPQALKQARQAALGIALTIATAYPVWGQTPSQKTLFETKMLLGQDHSFPPLSLSPASPNSWEQDTAVLLSQTLQPENLRQLRQLLEQFLAGQGGEATAELEQMTQGSIPLLEQTLSDEENSLNPEVEQELRNLRPLVERLLEEEDRNLTPDYRSQLATLRQLIVQIQSNNNELKLDPEIIENSPVLQRWMEEVPDVLAEIRNDPAFKTRLRLGYSQYPSTDEKGGFNVGVEDILVGRTGLSASINYDRVFEGDRQTFGADLQYYLLPLGSYVNVAPVVGYRNITTDGYWTDGPSVGLRAIFPLSRTGAADITLSQIFVSPGSGDEVGITSASVGYAVTSNLRLAVDIQKQNSIGEKDSRVGFVLEWMP